MHPDHASYYCFTGKSRFDKAVNTLLGIVEGIAIDSRVNDREIECLRGWLREHDGFRDRHPFNELVPAVATALADGVLAEEERLDIQWLCERLRSTEYYGNVTADIQRLHAIMGGILADGVVTEDELDGLSKWLTDHGHLRTCWPYDEVESLVTAVMADRRIDEQEQQALKTFFGEFLGIHNNQATGVQPASTRATVTGVCAVCPEIAFEGSLFCFTGASPRYTRAEFEKVVGMLGGTSRASISRDLDYVVIGAAGNPCWAYACYGRKIEAAVKLRQQGCHLLLVHENDFHDAVVDAING